MAGLLCKDWLLLRRQLWYYALLLGLYLTLTAAGVLDASFLCGLAVLYGTLLPTTCFSYDEAVHWERYAAATPAGRRGTVDGKYLLALLLAALSGGISLFLTALMEGPESALSLAVLVCTGLALAVNAVNLPLLLLLGVSRSRAALYFVFILFFGGGMALLLLFQRGLLPPPTPGLAAALPWLVTVLCAAAYAASWCIARKIYCKKGTVGAWPVPARRVCHAAAGRGTAGGRQGTPPVSLCLSRIQKRPRREFPPGTFFAGLRAAR